MTTTSLTKPMEHSAASGALRFRVRKKLGFALTLALFVTSGNPIISFLFGWEPVGIVHACILLLLLLHFGRLRFDVHALYACVVFLFIFFVQYLDFHFFPYITIAGFFTIIFIAWATVRLVPDFCMVYVRVLFFLAIMSLGFWFVGVVGMAKPLLAMAHIPPITVREWSNDTAYNLVIHTYGFYHNNTLPIRNCGMFGEPGFFAGYLNLALTFLALRKTDFSIKQYTRALTVFIVALLSTFSTAGYVVLPFVLLLHISPVAKFRSKVSSRALKAFVILVCIALAGFKFSEAQFLLPKINAQFQKVENRYLGWESTRLGSLLFDLEYIKVRPAFGWGLHSHTRFGLHPNLRLSAGQGNGLSNFTAKMGFVGLGVYLLYLFRGLMPQDIIR